MAYSELLKDISNIRDYMREFFVYGFKSREQINMKSARSYDNERRRIESWLSAYMSFHTDASGKNVFISADSRAVLQNPLYQAWKAKSFTKNDITLHFWLLDILNCDHDMTLFEILDTIDREYMPYFQDASPTDESTLRKKLREYTDLGLIETKKQGKQLTYKLPEGHINLSSWIDAILFFSEADPLGVIGAYLQDKFSSLSQCFSFKHNYLLFAPDCGVLLDLLITIGEHRRVEIETAGLCGGKNRRVTLLPLKIFISTQGGRQYVAFRSMYHKRFCFQRLDSIKEVRPLDVCEEFDQYAEEFSRYQKHLWGVSSKQDHQTVHIEMLLFIEPYEDFIVERLEREKRCGQVQKIDDAHWKFSADVYDAREMLPWVRTFIGRITAFDCTDETVKAQFALDLEAMAAYYNGGSEYVVQ